MMELIKNTRIDFMGIRKYAFAFSCVLVLLGLFGAVQIARGHPNLGLDLAAGTAIQLKFGKPVSMARIRQLLAGAGHGEANLQEVPGGNILIIKVGARGKEEKR